ncbi:hypothetical protein GCM10010512_13170 [Streptomyces thermoviolaceus subsp. thermoviolaceus]|nr:hypothetical protein GCM10010512_13170 [Streptomyces thermoviolaceus subsp. thermoviolaceus]
MRLGAMAGPAVRWGTVAGLGALWWWAVLRLLLTDDAGVLEGAVAAGGWGLSVLPVHCMPQSDERGRPGRRRRTAALIRRRTGGAPAGGDGDGGDRTGSATRPTASPAGVGPGAGSGSPAGVGSDAGPGVVSGGRADGPAAGEGGGASFWASGGWPYGHGGHTLTAGQGGWPFETGGDGPPRAPDDGSGPV